MYFKTTLFSLTFFTFEIVFCDVNKNYISTDVIKRKGGMSNYKKSILFKDNNFLGIYIGPEMRSTISIPNLSILERYGVCEGTKVDSTTTYQYFICPEYLEDKAKDFCCGPKGQQKCCTENDFRSSIKIVRNNLYATISTILGVFIGLLNILVISIIIFYWCYSRKKRNRPKNTYQIPESAVPQNYVTYPSRSDLTDNTASKVSIHNRNHNIPSILSKPSSNTPQSSVIVATKPMRKRY